MGPLENINDAQATKPLTQTANEDKDSYVRNAAANVIKESKFLNAT